MTRSVHVIVCLCLAAGAGPARAADAAAGKPSVQIRAVSETVRVGHPVWVDFLVHNPTDSTLRLAVTAAKPSDEKLEAMGLPLTHVFSAEGFRGVRISSGKNEMLGNRVVRSPSAGVPVLRLAPGATVGRRVDLTLHYVALRQSGTFRLQWRPYGGDAASNKIVIHVAALKQAVITTDFGRMTIAFDYDHAPKHVANFIDLARKGFYDSMLIHRSLPGILFQAGDPHGDGTGIRPDGVTLAAELSSVPVELGTVVMARKRDDLNSASCQFFICLTRIREFDDQYTVFGNLVGEESIATAQRLGEVPTDANARPLRPLYLRSVTIEDVPGQHRTTRRALADRKGDATTQPAASRDQVPLAPVTDIARPASTTQTAAKLPGSATGK